MSETRQSLQCISMQQPQLNGLEQVRFFLKRKAASKQGYKRIFLTAWEEEMHNDRMGIYKPNPITDFVLEPERKR